MAAGDEFELGRAAGKIEQRLDGHDRHFAEINGSIRDSVVAMTTLTLAVQRLEDRMRASQEQVLSTAQAVEKERLATAQALAAARDAADVKWSPFARIIAAVVCVAAVAGAAAAIWGLTRGR